MCNMNTRIQIVLNIDEKLRFKTAAKLAGMSLSAWLKECARLRLEEKSSTVLPDTLEKLEAFFSHCDKLEAGEEPDWAQQKEIIERSKTSGTTNT